MKTLKLRENFYWTGIVDANLRVFDIIMYTEFGTTYNSYVLKAGDKTILFETAKEKFFDEYLEKLREIIDVEHIDYLVVEHTEPDHAGSVEKLLDLNPGMKIIATGCALGFLKEIVNRDFTGIAARDNMAMTIGDRTLRFLFVPNLHWPDTVSYTHLDVYKRQGRESDRTHGGYRPVSSGDYGRLPFGYGAGWREVRRSGRMHGRTCRV